VNISGRLYAATFSDPDALNASLLDAFTRILAGGSLCSPTDENGTMYNTVFFKHKHSFKIHFFLVGMVQCRTTEAFIPPFSAFQCVELLL